MSIKENGPFYDSKKYIHRLLKSLQSFFDQPNDLRCLKIRKDNQGIILGWEIEETKFVFKNRDDYLKIIERAEFYFTNNCFYLKSFSYHFEPKDYNELMQFRVDLDKVSLHGNPDNRFSTKRHLCYPEDLKLLLKEFNALAAIYVALSYINSNEYPFDNKFADKYNQIVSNILGGQHVG